MDVVSSVILLIISSPVMLLTSLAVKLESKGPIFYRQDRVGKNGQIFKVIKFRSMVNDAEKDCGAVWVGEKDKRITRVGKIIRILRIDELPQLFNVLKGEMSMVGPRPERPEFVKCFLGEGSGEYDVIPYYGERLTVKPGITGWAQVMFSYAASLEESREKLEYDLYYIRNMSGILDFCIILKTIRVVLFGHGAK
jgi:lipopolysaccharide/colanic/teichoic acid biosynthesis glycosyltransferase